VSGCRQDVVVGFEQQQHIVSICACINAVCASELGLSETLDIFRGRNGIWHGLPSSTARKLGIAEQRAKQGVA
jgi:hypothetical protein